MRLILLAVGRTKAGPETELAARYQDRAAKAGKALGFRGVEAITLDESRAADVAARKAEEATAIRRARAGRLVLLDERGKSLGSADFASSSGAGRMPRRRPRPSSSVDLTGSMRRCAPRPTSCSPSAP